MVFRILDGMGRKLPRIRFCGMVRSISAVTSPRGASYVTLNIRRIGWSHAGVPGGDSFPLSERMILTIYFEDPREYVVVCPD